MPTILITNAYSARNKGDAGIVEGMVEDLRSRETFGQAEFIISSAAGPEAAEAYPGTVIDSLPSLKRRLSADTRIQGLGFLLFLLPLTMLWIACRRIFRVDLPVWSPLRRMLQAYDEADLVIAAGGGYLYTRSKLRGNFILLMQVCGYHFAVLLGKPVYLWSQSIGPFAARFQEWLVARSLRRVRLVIFREDETGRRLDRWSRHWDIGAAHQAADAAFLVSGAEPPPDLPPPAPGGIRVGLTVRKWWRNPADQHRYEQTFGRFAVWLAEEMKAEVFFVPQVTWTDGGDDDRQAARCARNQAGDNRQIHLIEEELSPAGIRGLCGKMDFLVGTRMHSNIYALSMRVPVLVVGYQPKSAGIMTRLGLERFVLPIEDLRLEDLQDRFRLLLEEKASIAAVLDNELPRLRREASRAGRLIEEDFTSLHELEDVLQPLSKSPGNAEGQGQ